MNNTYKIFGTLVFLFFNMMISTTHALIRTTSNEYAMIINTGGVQRDNYEYYWNNCSAIYKLLVNHGYDKKHITVLMSDGNDAGDDMNIGNSVFADSPRDLDGDGADDVSEPATSAID